MNTIKTITKFIFNKTVIRFATFVVLTGLVIQSSAVVYYYNAGKEHIRTNDPSKLQNRSETVFAFAPWKLKQGMKISSDEIVSHLKNISYAESDQEFEASFHVEDDRLKINSRHPQIFPDVILTFKNEKIADIAVQDQSVEKVLIEPLSMQNAVVYVNEEKLKELRIRRTVLQPDNLPAPIVDAVLSIEDKDFYNHSGVNWLMTVFRPIQTRGDAGGSSLTQQLIKNNIVDGAENEYWQLTGPKSHRYLKIIERKTAEVSMALSVEESLTKNEILAAYLSMNYMGSSGGVSLQGFAAASQEYFSTNIHEISDISDPSDISKAATLAGMIHGPELFLKYVRNGEKCEPNKGGCKNLLARRNYVLKLMHLNLPNKYPAEIIEKAQQEPLNFGFASSNRIERPVEFDSRIFTKFATQKENLPDELQKLRGEEGEVFVFTSIDERLQRDAVNIIKSKVEKLQPRVDAMSQKQRKKNSHAFEKLEKECQQKNSKNPKVCDGLFDITASLVAIDSRTGEILAMAGDVDAFSERSPASLVKPFFYLKALEQGSFFGEPFTAATFIDKDKDRQNLTKYCAREKNLGRSGTARTQLVRSWNIGACFAAQSANIPTNFVGEITKSTPQKKLIASLGGTEGSETSLLNIVRAYTIFANNGKLVNPTAYKNAFQIESDRANEIAFISKKATKRTHFGATFIVTDMMQSVVEKGTAAGFRQKAQLPEDIAFAGKTGSGMISDLWFVGFSPRIVVGVWVGMPENLPHLKRIDGFTGGKIAAPIAAEFIRSIKKYRPNLLQGNFIKPESVIKRKIDPQKGCLAINGGVEEYFIRGREPKICE